jgi:hypothetical protein
MFEMMVKEVMQREDATAYIAFRDIFTKFQEILIKAMMESKPWISFENAPARG